MNILKTHYKNLLLLVFLSFFCSLLSAQFSLGFKAGIDISKYRGKDIINSNYKVNIGPVIGFSVIYQKSEWLSFQADLAFENKGSKYNKIQTNQSGELIEYKDFEENMNYLSLPVMMKFDLGEKKRIYGYLGLYFSYLLSARVTGDKGTPDPDNPGNVIWKKIDRDFKTDINNYDIGAVLGLGSDFSVSERIIIFIDGRYYWGWTNVAESGHGKIFNSVFNFNLGLAYKLGNTIQAR